MESRKTSPRTPADTGTGPEKGTRRDEPGSVKGEGDFHNWTLGGALRRINFTIMKKKRLITQGKPRAGGKSDPYPVREGNANGIRGSR